MRILCHLFGCREDEEGFFCCDRCGTPSNGDEGWLPPGPIAILIGWARDVPYYARRLVTRWKCGQCGRYAFNKYQRDTEFCCPECHDAWLPF